MRIVVQLFLAANTILLMRKWNHACSLLVYVISVITPGRQRALTAFRRYYLLKNKLSDRMIKQLLNSVIAKYCDLSVSRRSIICLSLRLRQIIDLLATDKSWYFAQPRPIIANYYSFKILPQFWMAKSTCIILHNQLLMTKFGRLFCFTRKWPQKCSLLQVNEPLTEKTWGQGWVVLVVKTKWLTLHSFQE